MKAFDRQLKRGVLEMLLLHLLAEKATYGYELASILADRSAGRLSIQEGTLYPILYRLEDAGWIVPEWKSQGRSVPRKYYRLTAEGRGRLAAFTATWESFTAAVETVLEPGRASFSTSKKERS